jgi:peptidyl-prolyl cis-trans isomerase C
MFQDYYGDRSPEQVANVFGAQFTRLLFQLEPGSWQRPIESGFGWHLVWVDAMTASRVPAFEESESEVKAEWIAE